MSNLGLIVVGKSFKEHLDESELTTVAPTSVLFFNSDKLGKNYENDLFVGSVHNGTIYHFDLTKERI